MFNVDLIIMLISDISQTICIHPSVDAIYMYMYLLDLLDKLGPYGNCKYFQPWSACTICTL